MAELSKSRVARRSTLTAIVASHPTAASPAPAGPRLRASTILAAAIWLALVGSAMVLLATYSNTPGSTTVAPAQWPAESRIAKDPDRPTLVLLAHPHCPCTRSTLGELEILMAKNQGRLSAHVVFIRPPEFGEDWARTDLWHTASAIPGVTVSVDEGGLEARGFHAETSGQTLLYDRDGRLLFEGGITASRGHSGDNAGRSAVTAMLHHEAPAGGKTPVFGCGLFAPDCLAGEMKCTK